MTLQPASARPSVPTRVARRSRRVARRATYAIERAWLDARRPPVAAAVAEAPVRVLVYSPADLNLMDGSSIWVRSVAETLLADPDVAVTLPLRQVERRDLITGPLRDQPRVELVPTSVAGRVGPSGLSYEQVLDLAERLDRDRRFEAVLIRSFALCAMAVERARLRDRLWSAYIVEPERDLDDPAHLAALRRIAAGSRWLVAQSEPMRALTERLVPEATGRVLILPPAIPPTVSARADPAQPVRRLLYVGKLHPFYAIETVLETHARLADEMRDLELHVIGDKIDGGPLGPAWAESIRAGLADGPRVTWHRAMSREAVAALVADGGVAVSVWDHAYGSRVNDLVVSTKLLDYAAVGLPIVLTRTVAQQAILGADYPLFLDRPDQLEEALRLVLADPAIYRSAAERTFEASRAFTYDKVVEAIRPALHDGPVQAPDRAPDR